MVADTLTVTHLDPDPPHLPHPTLKHLCPWGGDKGWTEQRPAVRRGLRRCGQSDPQPVGPNARKDSRHALVESKQMPMLHLEL